MKTKRVILDFGGQTSNFYYIVKYKKHWWSRWKYVYGDMGVPMLFKGEPKHNH